MRKTFTATLFFIVTSMGILSAQDVRFSQYEYTPQLINPAATATDDYLIGYIDYRSQRVSTDLTFNTVSVFGKRPLFNKDGKRVAAVGIGFLSDSGEGLADINLYGLSTTFAYNFYLGERLALSTGAGLSFSRREVSLDDFTTGSQWVDNLGFLPDAGTGENFQNLSTNFLSVNAGLQLYQEDDNGNMKHYLGFSLFNANQPDESFLDNDVPRPIRYSLQAGARVFENDKYAISPEVIAEGQGGTSFLGVGANFTYYLKDQNPYDPIRDGSINLKIRNVIDEIIVLGIQLNQPNFSVGFSYDIGLSSEDLDPTTYATEFAFSIKKRITPKPKTPARAVNNYSIKQIRQYYNRPSSQQPTNSGQTQGEGNEDNNNDTSGDGTSDVGEVQFELKREFSFGFNQAILDESDKRYLDDLANLLKVNANLELQIVGHADNIGTENANRKISIARAKVVEAYLVEQGISKRRIKTEGKGASDPLVANDTEANRAKNRRVEFIIYKK